MTAQAPRRDFDADLAIMFATARSEWLDAFSRLEIAVLKCSERRGLAPAARGTPLRQRIAELRSIKASPDCARAIVDKLGKVTGSIEKLLPLRATIVHSALLTGKRDGTPVALFQNVLDAASGTPTYLVTTLEDLDRGRKQLAELTASLDSIP